jgi:SAM-dependent methyltransferase
MDYRPPAYEEASASEAPLHFYVEQGASIEFLARSVFVAAQKPAVRNYLDVGCGFGFGPDMATRIFGWNALGLDPGPLAAAGREMLGIRIESDQLSIEKPLLDAPYDAIVAMEVIEHIVNPDHFLRAVRSELCDTGILILSTPNGRYLDTCPDGNMLMPLLSPGYHAVIYTAEGLGALLRKAGFPNVSVVTASATLFAVASPSIGPLHAEIEINRVSYLGYLRSRFRDSPKGSQIHTGFGYRLLRSLTEDQAYLEALNVFAELRETTLARLGIDIAKPLDVASRVMDEEVVFSDVPTKYPFCLAGLLFCRGTIAADHERREDLAAAYFLATRFSAQMLLRSLNTIGISDGELAGLPTRAANTMKRLF